MAEDISFARIFSVLWPVACVRPQALGKKAVGAFGSF